MPDNKNVLLTDKSTSGISKKLTVRYLYSFCHIVYLFVVVMGTEYILESVLIISRHGGTHWGTWVVNTSSYEKSVVAKWHKNITTTIETVTDVLTKSPLSLKLCTIIKWFHPDSDSQFSYCLSNQTVFQSSCVFRALLHFHVRLLLWPQSVAVHKVILFSRFTVMQLRLDCERQFLGSQDSVFTIQQDTQTVGIGV